MDNKQANLIELNEIEKTKIQSIVIDKIWELEKKNEDMVSQVKKAQQLGSMNLANHLISNINKNTEIINHWLGIIQKLN